MYARKDIPTVLPDAVLRCRKLQTASNIAMDEMEKTKYRRINSLDWQQQTFQRVINERHKRWRMYDRAFRLKMKRELGPDLATALRLRTAHEEEQKFLLEQKLIERSFSLDRKESLRSRDDGAEPNAQVLIDQVSKANSAHPSLSSLPINDRSRVRFCLFRDATGENRREKSASVGCRSATHVDGAIIDENESNDACGERRLEISAETRPN